MWNWYFYALPCWHLTATSGIVIGNFRKKGKVQKIMEFALSFSYQKDIKKLELDKSIDDIQNIELA